MKPGKGRKDSKIEGLVRSGTWIIFWGMRIVKVFCLGLLVVPAWATAPQDEPIVKVVEKVRPAVVNIYTERIIEQQVVDPVDAYMNQFFGGGMARGNRILQTPVRNLGSGLIIRPDGFIVTYQHVASRANKLKIRVTLANGKDYEAKLLRDDDLQDLALIKVESPEPLPYLNLDKLSPNLLGQTVLVLGNPVGYESSVSAGILSAKDRTLTIGDLTMDGLLQTDAAINPGNSGGPLVDSEGDLVGLSSAKMSAAQNLPVESIGFAIPAERVKRFVEDAIAIVEGKKSPPPERSAAVVLKEKFGLELKDVTPEESVQAGYAGRQGLLVLNVQKGSPAEAAAIQKGMLVVGLGSVPCRSLEELPRSVRQLKGGEDVRVSILGATRQGNFVALRSGAVVLKAR
jgi:S1-C subfamily serine protease